MKSPSSGNGEIQLWQDVRARAIDEHLAADRRFVGERVAGIARWLFLVVFALVVNSDHGAGHAWALPWLNALLGLWGLANIGVSVLIWRRHRPGGRLSSATLALDLAVGAAVIAYVSNSTNPFLQAYLVTVVVAGVRLGRLGSLAAALVISLSVLSLRGMTSGAEPAWVFLYVVVALVSQQITTELERERRMAISRAAQADALREMSVNMASSLDLKDVFRTILDHAVRITVADRGSVFLLFGDQVQLVAGEADAKAETAAADVASRGEAGFLDNHARLVVPIASGDGVTAILALRGRGRPFTNEDLFMVNALAGSSAVPLANAMHFQRSSEEATTDGLTGLLNHREFSRRLEAEFAHRQHRSSPLSLVMIDIDHFKSVNDSMGHQHGDEVLRQAAAVVRQTARAHDIVARYGGDELAVIVTDAGAGGAATLAERLLEAVRRARIRATPVADLTFSIGVATYPEDAVYVEELLMAADQALYLAKREGRDRAADSGALVSRLRTDTPLLLELLAEAGPQVMVAAGHALDAGHAGMHAHSSRVAALAEAIGEKSGYPQSRLERLRAAAFLHQIVDVTTAGELLERTPFGPEVAAGVRHQRERWDGTGLPGGLAGEAIPIEARILAVADRFEILSAGREGPPLPISEALIQLEVDQGAFDPALLAALRALVEEGSLALNAPTALAGASS